MSPKEPSPWLLFGLVALICAWSLSCASAPPPPPQAAKADTPEPHLEAQAAASPLSVPSLLPQQGITKEPAKLPPPQPADIKAAVARVFEKAATTDSTRPQESFVVGDFNGDGSEDLAVVVKPSEGGLAEINSEVANWTLEDPANVAIPGGTASRQNFASKRVQAERDKTLLAIIHGVGPQGWRNSEAKQSYLLKNGAGGDMIVEPVTHLRSGKDKRKLPPLRGDAIQKTIAGKPGLLFWTGAKYAWYSTQAQPQANVH